MLEKEVLGLIIAVLALSLFIYAGFKLYSLWINQEDQNAQKIIDLVNAKAKSLSEGQTKDFPIRGLDDWMLTGWGVNEVGRPDQCYFKSCVCICKYASSRADQAASCKSKSHCFFTDDKAIYTYNDQRGIKLAQTPALMEIEISRKGGVFSMKNTAGEGDVWTAYDYLKAMCFMRDIDNPDMDKAVSAVVDRSAQSAGLIVADARTLSAADSLQAAINAGADVMIQDGTRVSGLDSYLNSLKGFSESTLELKSAAENAVIKNFPEQGIYNIVWDPVNKKVIGQVTQGGMIKKVSQSTLDVLLKSKDITGVAGLYGQTGGSIIKASPKIAEDAVVLAKDGTTLGKFSDAVLQSKNGVLKFIPKSTTVGKTLAKLGGKVFAVWGLACDITTIGIAGVEFAKMINAQTQETVAGQALDQLITQTMPETASRVVDQEKNTLTDFESVNTQTLSTLPQARTLIFQMHAFLDDATSEVSYLANRTRRFSTNYDQEGSSTITYAEQKILQLQLGHLREQLALYDAQFQILNESVLRNSDVSSASPFIFEKTPQTPFDLTMDYARFSTDPKSYFSDVIRDNTPNPNVPVSIYSSANTLFSFDKTDTSPPFLAFSHQKIGTVAGDGTITIDPTLRSNLLQQNANNAPVLAQLSHYLPLLDHAKVSRYEIFPYIPAQDTKDNADQNSFLNDLQTLPDPNTDLEVYTSSAPPEGSLPQDLTSSSDSISSSITQEAVS